MSDVNQLYERNATFAGSFDQGDLPIKPTLSTLILSCVDARVDPSKYAGLELGDALVLRNVGARVTDAVALEVAMLWTLMEMASGSPPNLELVIVQHTKCGMARFAVPEVATKITERFGTEEVVDTYAIVDLEESLATDLARLRANAVLPRDLKVSGHIYDIETGRLQQVIETTKLTEG